MTALGTPPTVTKLHGLPCSSAPVGCVCFGWPLRLTKTSIVRCYPGSRQMKLTAGISIFIALATGAQGDEGSLREARSRWLHGNYQEATGLYRAQASDPRCAVAARIGL